MIIHRAHLVRRLLGLALTAMVGVVAIAATVLWLGRPEGAREYLLAGLGMGAGLASLGLGVRFMTLRDVIISARGLRLRSLWGGTRIPWGEVAEVRCDDRPHKWSYFSDSYRRVEVISVRGARICLHPAHYPSARHMLRDLSRHLLYHAPRERCPDPPREEMNAETQQIPAKTSE